MHALKYYKKITVLK